jgi:hypothetical protein
MAQSTEDKKKPTTFQLKTPHNVRTTLARLFRLRYAGTIDSNTCRDLVYTAKAMLEHDKHILESENAKRIEKLELLFAGEGGTVIDRTHIDNPYAADLKRQLENERKVNADLQNEIMTIKRQLAGGQ